MSATTRSGAAAVVTAGIASDQRAMTGGPASAQVGPPKTIATRFNMSARMILLAISLCITQRAVAQSPLGAPWDSVGKILRTSGTLTGGYYRYGWPRRDIMLRIGTVTVAPALA